MASKTTSTYQMADITFCWAWALVPYYSHKECPLINGVSPLPGCEKCAAYTSTIDAMRAHLAAGGTPVTLANFRRRHMAPCAFVRDMAFNMAAARMCF